MDEALIEARQNPGRVVLLFEDEASVYRQPTQAPLFHLKGRQQPAMNLACGSNRVVRMAGFLNAAAGTVHSWPWLNPIEKLWRLLKQKVVHAHPYSHDFNELKAALASFLENPGGSPSSLLQYVGLLGQ